MHCMGRLKCLGKGFPEAIRQSGEPSKLAKNKMERKGAGFRAQHTKILRHLTDRPERGAHLCS